MVTFISRSQQALHVRLSEIKVTNTKVTTREKTVITLDPRCSYSNDKAYLRYMIQTPEIGFRLYIPVAGSG